MNKHWKIAFCGLGSIGTRHLRNIRQVLDTRGDSYSIDWISSGKKKTTDEFAFVINNTFMYEDDINGDYDIVFITNPTYKHYETIERFQWKSKSLFIEKPLFDTYKKPLKVLNPQCVFYIACPVRYKKVIQYLKEKLNPDEVLSAIAVCSSYLPEWRIGTDYRKGYSAIKNMGGGVSLDLIHEIDYLSYLFGTPKKIYNIRDHVSSLELDSDDVSVYIAKLDKAIVQVYLDYYGRKDLRTLTLFCKNETLFVDLLTNTVNYLKEGKRIAFQEVRDDFQKSELQYFIDVIEGIKPNNNDLNRAYRTLKNTFGRL